MNREPGKLVSSAGAAFLLSFTLLFAGPSFLYYTNLLQIPYYYADLVWIFAGATLAAGTLLSVLLLLPPGAIHQRAVVLVFALGLLFWIQGNLLVWDYGVLDGREIAWKNYLLNGLIDSAVWIVVLGAALLKSPFFYRHVAWAGALLILVQGGGLAAEIWRAPEEPDWKNYVIGYGDESMFEFSSRRNVIVMVLDMFQSDVFAEIIDEDQQYRDLFDGFTYFRNTVGGFPTTYPSITFILTGRYYDNSVPIREFIEEAFLTGSIPRLLKENGYRVDLFEKLTPQAVYLSDEVASNAGREAHWSRVDRRVDGVEGAGDLLRLTLFRHVPHVLKRRFYFVPYVETRDRKKVDRDIVFYNSLVAGTTVAGEVPVFKFYHLKGIHDPYRLDSQLRRAELPPDRSGCREQARGIIKIVQELIRQLKENGIYDDSLIFIIGDHGNPWASVGLNCNLPGGEENFGQPGTVKKEVICSGIPLMLLKPFRAAGELKISDAPVSLGDIPQTVATELGLAGEFPGRSVLAVNEGENRERKFFFYNWDSRWDRGYLPRMEEFAVNGHSWRAGSWKSTGRIHAPPREE